jgi:hypothetical protein
MSVNESLESGSVVNVHRHDGSSTGGYEYRGLLTGAAIDQPEPVLLLVSVDDADEQIEVRVSEIAWIDTLAVPFTPFRI